MNWVDAVGKYCLIKSKADWWGNPKEVKIVRLSSSNRYVKFYYRYDDGNFHWREIDNLILIEILDYE